MTGVQALEHIKSLRPPYLSHNNSVRPHAKTGAYQLPDSNFPAALHIAVACLQAHQIGQTLQLQFRTVLYGDDPFLRADKMGERVHKRGFPAGGSSADKNVIFCPDQFLQILCGFQGERTCPDQPFHGDGFIGKPPDCDNGTVDGDGTHDNVHPCAVGKPGIHNGRCLVHHPVAPCHNLLNHILELFLGLKAHIQLPQSPVLFYENMILAIDHNLCHRAVLHKYL